MSSSYCHTSTEYICIQTLLYSWRGTTSGNEQAVKIHNRKVHYADGVIRLNKLYVLEILLLETSGCFQNKDERKISFDNIKGMFALLTMIKTVADRFSYAPAESFQKLKLYFVQASDEFLRLWSIQYVSNGVYLFNREDKIVILEGANQVQQVLTPLLDFFYHVKLCDLGCCNHPFLYVQIVQ